MVHITKKRFKIYALFRIFNVGLIRGTTHGDVLF